MADNILEIRHLSKSFGTHEVLRDIDFDVKKGDVISIIGASGSGKSTLLRCVNLLETPTSGDILYHGPRNDLPDEYAPKQVLAMLNERRERLFCVRGNCDTEVDQMVLTFPILADYSVFPAADRLVYATHGHVFNTSHLPPLCPGDILLHGHTHIPAWEPFGEGNLYLNPGSVSIPKNGSARSYMTLEDTTFTWKTLPGEAYHTLTI